LVSYIEILIGYLNNAAKVFVPLLIKKQYIEYLFKILLFFIQVLDRPIVW